MTHGWNVNSLVSISARVNVRRSDSPHRNACINNLRQIDNATQEWAADNRQGPATTVAYTDIQPYLKGSVTCPAAGSGATFDGSYSLSTVADKPTCKISPTTHQLPADGSSEPHPVRLIL
jgi:hypothetical protein